MDVKSVSGKSCNFMKGKTGRLLIACSFLILQLVVGAQAFYIWITQEAVLKILKVDTMESWGYFVPLVLSIGLALAVSIATISLMVVLLVGIQKDDTRLINIYFTFSFIMFIVTVLITNVSEFAFDINSTMAINRILFNAVNAVFLCMISTYWVTFELSSWLHEDA